MESCPTRHQQAKLLTTLCVGLLVCFFFFFPCCLWDLGFPTRDQTLARLAVKSQSLTTGPPGKSLRKLSCSYFPLLGELHTLKNLPLILHVPLPQWTDDRVKP